MNLAEPTADEFRDAYKRARLRRIGVSLQKAISTPCISKSLRIQAIAVRQKEQQKDGTLAPLQQANI